MCEIEVEVGHDVLKANEECALRTHHILNGFGITAFNIMGAIGSGKTTLIELAIDRLGERYRIGVIAGDIVADIDADRFKRYGVPVIAMNTGKECHLDAHLIENALDQLPLDNLDILLIENVGNLICPTDYSLGESKRVVIVSVSEGDDIVKKHPMIFKTCDLAIVNKVDIADAIGADADNMIYDALRINPHIEVMKTSKKIEKSVDRWIEFIEASTDAHR